MKTISFFLIIITISFFACTPSANNIPDLIPYRMGEKWGYVNPQKEVLIPCQFEDALPFWGAIALVKISEGHKIINKAGAFLLDFQFVTDTSSYIIQDWHIVQGTLVFYEKERGWGLMDSLGNLLIQPVGNRIEKSTGGLWRLEKNNRWALFSAEGLQLTKFKYESLEDFSEGLACFSILEKKEKQSRKRYGYLDQKGQEIIPAQFQFAASFSSNLALVGQAKKDSDCKGLHYGYINKKGAQVIPFQYDQAHVFTEGSAIVELDPSCTYLNDNKCGVIDATGQEIIAITYDKIERLEKGIWRCTNYPNPIKNKKGAPKVVLINETGKAFCPPNENYEIAGDFIIEQGGDWTFGVRNRQGEVLIPIHVPQQPKREEASILVEVLLWEDQFAFLNPINKSVQTGKITEFKMIDTVACRFSVVPNEMQHLMLGQDAYFACMDRRGKVLFEPQTDILYPMNKNWLMTNDKKGNYPIDWQGNAIGTARYDYISFEPQGGLHQMYKMFAPDSTCYSSKTGEVVTCSNIPLFGLLNEEGQVVLEAEFLNIESISKDWLAVQDQSKWTAIVDRQGKEVLKPTYLFIGPFERGLARVKTLGGKEGYIDERFNEYFENGNL